MDTQSNIPDGNPSFNHRRNRNNELPFRFLNWRYQFARTLDVSSILIFPHEAIPTFCRVSARETSNPSSRAIQKLISYRTIELLAPNNHDHPQSQHSRSLHSNRHQRPRNRRMSINRSSPSQTRTISSRLHNPRSRLVKRLQIQLSRGLSPVSGLNLQSLSVQKQEILPPLAARKTTLY